MENDDDFSLPELKTSPLWMRSILASIFIGLLVIVLALLVVEQLLADIGIDDSSPRAVLCNQVEADQSVFRIDPAQSEVRYQVDEFLLQSNQFGTPIGRTNAIDGFIVVDMDEPSRSRVCELVINVSQLQTDNDRRDRIVRVRYLNTIDYPEASFEPTHLLDFPENAVQGQPFDFRLRGQMTIKGQTRTEIWNVTATFEESQISGVAETVILMSNYGVGPVNIAGFVESSDDVTLTFDFVAIRADE
jgi:polyisoprenoid-binding protein YceI